MKRVAIIIKTFNEEANIARAITSSLKALQSYQGQIIVADSASTDKTVDAALSFPATIVQIARPDERCCGIGPQLGFQHSEADYVYVLDGDMELDPNFIQRAMDILEERSIAGVGGYVHETRIENLEFQGRVKRQKRSLPSSGVDVQFLAGGALYRRAAIEEVGYLSDRNLHAFEEYDLGMRLRKRGWRLIRVPDHAADHFSYAMNSFRLLYLRLRSGYVFGIGNLARSAIAAGYLKELLFNLRAMQIAIGVWIFWAASVFIAITFPGPAWTIFTALALLFTLIIMTFRLGSLKLAFYSILSWHISAIGLVVGLLQKRKSPFARIESRVLKQA